MLLSRISPAPSLAPLDAHAMASMPVPLRPPWVVISKPLAAPRARRASTESTTHWLPNLRAARVSKSGSRDRPCVDADLVRTGAQQRIEVVHLTNAASDRERDEHCVSGAPHDVQHGRAATRTRGDVQEDELVGTFSVVASGQFHRIPGVAQPLEVDAFDHPAGIDVQARDHPHGQAHLTASSASGSVNAPA